MSKNLEFFVYLIAYHNKFGVLCFTGDVFCTPGSARDFLASRNYDSFYEYVKVKVNG